MPCIFCIYIAFLRSYIKCFFPIFYFDLDSTAFHSQAIRSHDVVFSSARAAPQHARESHERTLIPTHSHHHHHYQRHHHHSYKHTYDLVHRRDLLCTT